MTIDKRSVKTDALETLGSIIDASQKRDAIHIAVEPVVSVDRLLRPGDDVGFKEGGVGVCDNPVGIVDPFLKRSVLNGEHFWLLVYPRTITSLRHVWTHPAFPQAEESIQPPQSETDASKRWIEKFAARIPLSYETIMRGARDYVEDQERGGYGKCLSFGGLLEGEHVPDKFWPHYEWVSGTQVDQAHRGSFFSCSC